MSASFWEDIKVVFKKRRFVRLEYHENDINALESRIDLLHKELKSLAYNLGFEPVSLFKRVYDINLNDIDPTLWAKKKRGKK